MWNKKIDVTVYGKKISLRKLAEAFNVSYDSCLFRYHKGCRDPWELLFGKGGKPVKFTINDEQKSWLRETMYARKGQIRSNGSSSHIDDEWDIACDLICIPRIFAEELKEAMQ